MIRSTFMKLALAAIAAVSVGVANARADLILNIIVVGQGSMSFTTPGNPQTGFASVNGAFAAGGFSVSASSGLQSLQGGSGIQHTHTINFAYTGPLGAGSQTLIVQMIGTNYASPLGIFGVSSNGSPSVAGAAANSVVMQSGVSATNAGLPNPPSDFSAFLANSLTGGTGTLGSASSVLVPNPSTNGPFTVGPGLYSFYQVFTFSGFTANGLGSFSAGALLTPVPEPATIVGAGIALASIGAFRFRRRRQPTA